MFDLPLRLSNPLADRTVVAGRKWQAGRGASREADRRVFTRGHRRGSRESQFEPFQQRAEDRQVTATLSEVAVRPAGSRARMVQNCRRMKAGIRFGIQVKVRFRNFRLARYTGQIVERTIVSLAGNGGRDGDILFELRSIGCLRLARRDPRFSKK